MYRHLGFTRSQAMRLTRHNRMKATQVVHPLTPVSSKQVTAPDRRRLLAMAMMIESAQMTVMMLDLDPTLLMVVMVKMELMQMMVMTVNVESAE